VLPFGLRSRTRWSRHARVAWRLCVVRREVSAKWPLSHIPALSRCSRSVRGTLTRQGRRPASEEARRWTISRSLRFRKIFQSSDSLSDRRTWTQSVPSSHLATLAQWALHGVRENAVPFACRPRHANTGET
jgi:hypothetical protein